MFYILLVFMELRETVVFLSIDMALPKKAGNPLNNWAAVRLFGQRAKWHTWVAVTGLFLFSLLHVVSEIQS